MNSVDNLNLDDQTKEVKSFLDSLTSFWNQLNELMNNGAPRTVERLFAILGAAVAVNKSWTLVGYASTVFSLIVVGVDKILDPTATILTGLFVRYARAVRIAAPITVLCFIAAFIIPLTGFSGQSVWQMGIYTALAMLIIMSIFDYIFVVRFDEPQWLRTFKKDGHNPGDASGSGITPSTVLVQSGMRRRILTYLVVGLGSFLFIPGLHLLLGGVEPTSIVLSAPFLLIISGFGVIVLLPVLAIGYVLMHKYANAPTGNFLETVFNPLLTLLFFVAGAVLSFELLHVWQVPVWFFIGGVIALLILAIASIRNQRIRTFLKNATVANAFIKLGLLIGLCVLCILIPYSGDRAILGRSVQNWFQNRTSYVVHDQSTRPAGDILFDQRVDSNDLAILRKLVDTSQSLDVLPIDSAYADVNQDGFLNELDTLLFVRALLNDERSLLQRPSQKSIVQSSFAKDDDTLLIHQKPDTSMIKGRTPPIDSSIRRQHDPTKLRTTPADPVQVAHSLSSQPAQALFASMVVSDDRSVVLESSESRQSYQVEIVNMRSIDPEHFEIELKCSRPRPDADKRLAVGSGTELILYWKDVNFPKRVFKHHFRVEMAQMSSWPYTWIYEPIPLNTVSGSIDATTTANVILTMKATEPIVKGHVLQLDRAYFVYRTDRTGERWAAVMRADG